MKNSFHALLCAAFVVLGGFIRAASISTPVASAELDLWVRIGRSPAEIAGDIRARGLLQTPDDGTLKRLRAAEADPALLLWLTSPEAQALVVSPEAAERARETRARLDAQEAANRAAALARLNPASETQTSLTQPAAPDGAAAAGAKEELSFLTDYDAARTQAAAERKYLFLVFAAADEDASSLLSQRLREVCRHPDFLKTARERLLGVRLACPRTTDSVRAGTVAARNRELMPLFNIERLPTVWLADSNGGRLFKLVRWEENPRAFLEEFQVAFEKARTKSGSKVPAPARVARTATQP